MTPERVLQHSPLVLDQRQRERYFADGGPVPKFARAGVRAAMEPLARWDRWAASHPDHYVASSLWAQFQATIPALTGGFRPSPTS